MKADTQYNDFVGTAAADMSDHTTLSQYLTSKGVDIKRYEPFGVNLYSGEGGFIDVSIICVDKEQSTSSSQHIVDIGFEKTSAFLFILHVLRF